MSTSPLTTTSYAVLGLLAIKPWSSYELTQQMDRSLGRIWPRATSKLYEEPKKLVEHGFARASTERNGRRSRTVYAITAKGRRTLAKWLQERAERAAGECRPGARSDREAKPRNPPHLPRARAPPERNRRRTRPIPPTPPRGRRTGGGGRQGRVRLPLQEEVQTSTPRSPF